MSSDANYIIQNNEKQNTYYAPSHLATTSKTLLINDENKIKRLASESLNEFEQAAYSPNLKQKKTIGEYPLLTADETDHGHSLQQTGNIDFDTLKKVERICLKILKKSPEVKTPIEELRLQIKTALLQLEECRKSNTNPHFKFSSSHFTLYSASNDLAYLVTTPEALDMGKFKKFYKVIRIEGKKINARAGIAMSAQYFQTFKKQGLRIDPIKTPLEHCLPNSEFTFESQDGVFLVYPLYDGNIYTLAEKENWGFNTRLLAMTQACQAMKEMHENDYSHGDVKPNNFYLKRKKGLSKVILGDTDSALHTLEPRPKKYIWTPGFTDFKNMCKKESDTHAFGFSLIVMFDNLIPNLRGISEMNPTEYEAARSDLEPKQAQLIDLIRDLRDPDLKLRPSSKTALTRLQDILNRTQ